jgi:hypothetical protein
MKIVAKEPTPPCQSPLQSVAIMSVAKKPPPARRFLHQSVATMKLAKIHDHHVDHYADLCLLTHQHHVGHLIDHYFDH